MRSLGCLSINCSADTCEVSCDVPLINMPEIPNTDGANFTIPRRTVKAVAPKKNLIQSLVRQNKFEAIKEHPPLTIQSSPSAMTVPIEELIKPPTKRQVRRTKAKKASGSEDKWGGMTSSVVSPTPTEQFPALHVGWGASAVCQGQRLD